MKNKILLSVLLFIVVICIKNNCFATTTYTSVNGNDYNLADFSNLEEYNTYDSWVIFKSTENSKVTLYFFNNNSVSSGSYSSNTAPYLIQLNSTDILLPCPYRFYNYSGGRWIIIGGDEASDRTYQTSCYDLIACSSPVNSSSGVTYFDTFTNPYITNENLSSGTFDYLVINSGDFVGENWQDFYLLSYDYSSETSEDTLPIYPRKEISLAGGTKNKYFTQEYDGSYIFMIPNAELGLTFKNDYNYAFKLATKERVETEGGRWFS